MVTPPGQANQPLHSDRHRIPVNLTLIFSLAIAVVGIVQGDPRWVIVGLAVAAFSWLTSPRRYLIYQNALVIEYGRPRVKVIYFNQIANLEMLSLAIGARVRVRLRSGRREMLQARDSQTFHDRLQQALDDFRRIHPETVPPEQTSSSQAPT